MIPRAAALAILLAITAYLLSEMGFRSHRLFSTLGLVALLLIFAEDSIISISKISEIGGIGEVADVTRAAVKVVASGYVFGIASDVSAELGESGISRGVELCGRVEIFLIVLPYLCEALEAAIGLAK